MKNYFTGREITKSPTTINSKSKCTNKNVKCIFFNKKPNITYNSSPQTIYKQKNKNFKIPKTMTDRDKKCQFIKKNLTTTCSIENISSFIDKKAKIFPKQMLSNTSRNLIGKKIAVNTNPLYNENYFSTLKSYNDNKKIFRVNTAKNDMSLFKNLKLSVITKQKKSNSLSKGSRSSRGIKTKKNYSSSIKRTRNIKPRNNYLSLTLNNEENISEKKGLKTFQNINKSKIPLLITINLENKTKNNIITKNKSNRNEFFISILNKKDKLNKLIRSNKEKKEKDIFPTIIKNKYKTRKVSPIDKKLVINIKNKSNKIFKKNNSNDNMIKNNRLNARYLKKKNDMLNLNNNPYMDNNKFKNNVYNNKISKRSTVRENYGKKSSKFCGNLKCYNINNYMNYHVDNNNFDNIGRRLENVLSIENVDNIKLLGIKKNGGEEGK